MDGALRRRSDRRGGQSTTVQVKVEVARHPQEGCYSTQALAARRSDGSAPMTPLGWDVAAAKAAGTAHPSAKAPGAIAKSPVVKPKAKSKSRSPNPQGGGKDQGKAKGKGQKGKAKGKGRKAKGTGKKNGKGGRKIVFRVPGKGTRKGGGQKQQEG